MSFSRRNFIVAAATAAAGAISAPYIATNMRAAAARGDGIPSKIIHYVSDGTSPSMVTISDVFSKMIRGRGLCWMEMSRTEGTYTGLMDMASLNSCVTDSSAASSSWGSGSRINNGAVNCLPDGTLLKPLYELLREPHWKRGLVTTTEITHATPAGFGSACKSRGDTTEIANYYRNLGIDVLLGGGQSLFNEEMLASYDRYGYQIIKTSDELKKIDVNKKVLGLFASGHLPMTIDWLNHKSLQQKVPQLAEMTAKALEMLGEHEHFILQVEGGRVDHACHASDAPGATYDHIAFDDAIQIGLDYQKRHPDTLIVVTADHGCGGPSMNGMGSNYTSTPKLLPNMKNALGSFERLTGDLKKCENAVQVQRYLKEKYSVQIGVDKADLLLLARDGKGCVGYDPIGGFTGQLGQVLGNYFGISWGSGNHSGDFVALVAKGPGAERFKGNIRNTDVFRNYMDFAGMNFRNKEWTGETQKTASVSFDGHWFDTALV